MLGHIKEITRLPPEVSAQTPCEFCVTKNAEILIEMNPKHSNDMELCENCANQIFQINKMMDLMEISDDWKGEE